MTILKITLSISFSEGFKSPWHVSVTLWLGCSNKWEKMKNPGLGAHFLWGFTNIILQTLFRVLIQLMLRTLTFPLWEFRERRTNSIWGKGISRENKSVSSLTFLHLPKYQPHTKGPTTPLYPLGKIKWTAAFLTNQHEERKWRNKRQAFAKLSLRSL